MIKMIIYEWILISQWYVHRLYMKNQYTAKNFEKDAISNQMKTSQKD